ncbi:hypothetical protein ACWIT3_01155 [Pasteurella sp. P03HT]
MKVIYTETANIELDKFYKKQKELIEKNIIEEKSIFGDEIIEVTSSDIKKASEGIIYINKRNNKIRILEQLSKIYLIIGALITLLGGFYPYFDFFIKSEPQKVAVVVGLSMTLFSIIISIFLFDKRKLEMDRMKKYENDMVLKEYFEQIKKYNDEQIKKYNNELENMYILKLNDLEYKNNLHKTKNPNVP